MKELRFLKDGSIVYTKSGDIKGEGSAQSIKNAKRIIKSAENKVLVIDEAYLLNDTGNGKYS